MDKFKGYRTIAIAVITIILGGLQVSVDVIPAEWTGVVIAFIGLLNLGLRYLTNTPPGPFLNRD